MTLVSTYVSFHEKTSVDEFLLNNYAKETMPEEIVHRLAARKDSSLQPSSCSATRADPTGRRAGVAYWFVAYLLSTRQEKAADESDSSAWHGAPGAPYWQEGWGCKRGVSFELLGKNFQVVRVAPEAGTSDDLRVWIALSDAQQLLHKPDLVNEIRAIDCLCISAGKSPLEFLRDDIAQVAPEAQVAMLTQIASARAKQRQMMERLIETAIPAIVVSATLLVGILAFVNVRQRKQELGILRAVGYQSWSIASLVLGKALVTGLLGGLLGCVAGVGSGQGLCAASRYDYRGEVSQLPADWLLTALVVAPLVACIASLMAASLAVGQHPADVLREP